MAYSNSTCESCTQVKYTCGDIKTNAYCTYISKDVLPEWSELKNEGCLVTYETTAELYDEVDKLKTLLTFDKSPECFEYKRNEKGEVTLQTVIDTLIEKTNVCNTIANSSNTNSTYNGSGYCNIDYKGLIPQNLCADRPKSICEHLQIIVDIIKDLPKQVKPAPEPPKPTPPPPKEPEPTPPPAPPKEPEKKDNPPVTLKNIEISSNNREEYTLTPRDFDETWRDEDGDALQAIQIIGSPQAIQRLRIDGKTPTTTNVIIENVSNFEIKHIPQDTDNISVDEYAFKVKTKNTWSK